jgi:hypothetical protein
MRDSFVGPWHFGQGGRLSGIRGSERLATVNSAGIEYVGSFRDPSRPQITLLQADHLVDGVDQQREQGHDNQEGFDAFAAVLLIRD